MPASRLDMHPRGRAHAVGVDARQLGHPRALDDRAHAQAERRVAEEHEQRAHDRDRHDRGRDVVTAQEHLAERVVRSRTLGHDALRLERRADVEEQLHDLRDRDEQTQRRDQPGHRWCGAQVPEQHPVEHEAQQRREDERDQHRDRDREVVAGPRLVVDRAGRERLRTEGQVEDARGLVRQHQTDGEQRVDAAEGETSEDGAQDLVQRVALPGSCCLRGRSTSSSPNPWARTTCTSGGTSFGALFLKQFHGLPGSPQIATNFPFFTWVKFAHSSGPWARGA